MSAISHQITVYRVGKNPYPQTIPSEEFWSGVNNIVVSASRLVPPEGAFGLVVLDPTMPNRVPSLKSVLFMATIGVIGDSLLPNALNKVCWHRNHQTDYGHMLHNQPHRLPDGCFRYGGSVEVDGTYVGGSGLEVYEDRELNLRVASEFNRFVAARRAAWERALGDRFEWWYEVPGPALSAVHDVDTLKCECYGKDIVSFTS